MQRFENFRPLDEARQMPPREIHTTVAYNDENPDPAHQIHALGAKAAEFGLQVGRAYSHSILQAHAKKHRLKIVNRSNEEMLPESLNKEKFRAYHTREAAKADKKMHSEMSQLPAKLRHEGAMIHYGHVGDLSDKIHKIQSVIEDHRNGTIS